jgi:hypothetical protein
MATRHPAAAAAQAFDREGAPATPSQGAADPSADASVTTSTVPVAKTEAAAPAVSVATPQVDSPAPPDPDIEGLRSRLLQAEADRDHSRQAALDAARLVEQYEMNGASAAEQLQAARARITEVERLNEDTAAQLRQAQRERSYAIDYSGLESITAEAARELDEKLLRPRLTRIEDDYQRSLHDAQAAFDNRVKELTVGQSRLTDTQKNASLAITNREILRQHDDFESLLRQPEFNGFLDSRIPGSRRSWRDEMKAAYYDGDADYVCGVLDAFKSRGEKPDLKKVADAGVTKVATEPAAPVGRAHTMKEYEDMSFKFRSRQITAAAWTKYRADFDRAEAEGRVQ